MIYLCSQAALIHRMLAYPRSLPLSRTACPYFCSFVISASPCLTTSVYCLFLSSGRLVSMMLLTRSIVQGMRSAAMKLARSLISRSAVVTLSWPKGEHTDRGSRQIPRRLWPCSPSLRHGSFAVAADNPEVSSRARTTLCVQTSTDLG